MDQEAIEVRLDRLEKENRLLKQWVARLKQENERLTQRIQPLESRTPADTGAIQVDPDQSKRLANLERRQRILAPCLVIAALVLGGTTYSNKGRLDRMKDFVSTRELHIVDDDSNMGITMANSKEHGPSIRMMDRQDYLRGQITGTPRIIMNVSENGKPSLLLLGKSTDDAGAIFQKPGPLGVAINLHDGIYPQLLINGRDGKSSYHVFIDPTKPTPVLEITDIQGNVVSRFP
jgi:hypothetical protein